MKITHILGTVIAAGMLLASACSKDSPSSNDNSGGSTTNCSSVSAQFSANVLPLILTKCSYNSGCHGTGSTNSGGALTNYTQIKARSSNIKSQVNAGLMPQGGSLTSAEKAIITCWVDAGGPNN